MLQPRFMFIAVEVEEETSAPPPNKNPGFAPDTGLHSEQDMTCTYQTSRHPMAIHIVTLAILTAHRAGTPTAVPSPEHSWQEHTCSHQGK